MPKKLDPMVRFMNKVIKTDSCWLWTGYKTPKGYGIFSFKRRATRAHHFLLPTKPSPPLEACHTCDNPGCVNPDHIYIGTHTDNMRDASNRHRWKSFQNVKRGESSPAAVLKELDVKLIRAIGNLYGLATCIGNHFGIRKESVKRIWKNTRWKHVSAGEFTSVEKSEFLRMVGYHQPAPPLSETLFPSLSMDGTDSQIQQ